MAIFKRNKGNKDKGGERRAGGEKSASSSSSSDASGTASKEESDETESLAPRETSPQRVGVVSGILTTSATLEESLPIGEIVDRHFGPDTVRGERILDVEKVERPRAEGPALPPQHDHLRAVENLLDEEESLPRLEVDPMAHIGHATTITGSIVAEEDLEIQGTIEGSIRLADHKLTVGSDGLVKANVEAHTVLVLGRISGDVVASELVEIKAGGVIGGDVKSPRVIMHDGGVVVGGLDMSAALPSSGRSSMGEETRPPRPKLIRVEPVHDLSKDGDRT